MIHQPPRRPTTCSPPKSANSREPRWGRARPQRKMYAWIRIRMAPACSTGSKACCTGSIRHESVSPPEKEKSNASFGAGEDGRLHDDRGAGRDDRAGGRAAGKFHGFGSGVEPLPRSPAPTIQNHAGGYQNAAVAAGGQEQIADDGRWTANHLGHSVSPERGDWRRSVGDRSVDPGPLGSGTGRSRKGRGFLPLS